MNRRLVGFAAAAVALVVLWWVLLWGPRSRAIGQARERAASAETERSALTARIQRLKEAQADEPRQRARLEALRTAIPDEPDLGQFILDANDAASRAGVDFLSISPSPPAASPDPTLPASIALAITVDGGYFQVLDYVNRLDGLSRIVVVENLSLTSGSSETGATTLSVSITARMYTTADPAGVPGAVDPAAPAGAPSTTLPTTATTAVPTVEAAQGDTTAVTSP